MCPNTGHKCPKTHKNRHFSPLSFFNWQKKWWINECKKTLKIQKKKIKNENKKEQKINVNCLVGEKWLHSIIHIQSKTKFFTEWTVMAEKVK